MISVDSKFLAAENKLRHRMGMELDGYDLDGIRNIAYQSSLIDVANELERSTGGFYTKQYLNKEREHVSAEHRSGAQSPGAVP